MKNRKEFKSKKNHESLFSLKFLPWYISDEPNILTGKAQATTQDKKLKDLIATSNQIHLKKHNIKNQKPSHQQNHNTKETTS